MSFVQPTVVRLVARAAPRVVLRTPVRAMSSSVVRRATEPPKPEAPTPPPSSESQQLPDTLAKMLPPGFEKAARSRTAIDAINALIVVLKKNGVDLHSGQRPTLMQLARLATDKELRDATAKGTYVI